MSGETLSLTCSCCDADLVVDVATGEVLSHRQAKKPSGGGKSFDDLLAGIDDGKSRADQVFSREMRAIEDRDRLLEAKFEEAMKRAGDSDGDTPPKRPFDLD